MGFKYGNSDRAEQGQGASGQGHKSISAVERGAMDRNAKIIARPSKEQKEGREALKLKKKERRIFKKGK